VVFAKYQRKYVEQWPIKLERIGFRAIV